MEKTDDVWGKPATQPTPVIPADAAAPDPAASPITSPADQKYQKIVVTELAKCGLCMGKIKPDSVAIECACGIYYHEQCGKRFGRCPNCGVSFEARETWYAVPVFNPPVRRLHGGFSFVPGRQHA